MKQHKRKCPICLNFMFYTLKNNMLQAEKKKIKCVQCSFKLRNYKGKNNPFYGRNHSQETKQKISKANTGRISEYNIKQSHKGKSNPMFGKTFYDVWLLKYGKEEADLRMKKFKEKQSFLKVGSKNAMYGKKSPVGSGNGWSGWYKNWYFRSLLELSFMIKVIERFNFNWENAEKSKYKIHYLDYNNTQRTYRADFILNNKYMIECKPLKLQNTPLNTLKLKAAQAFCLKNNLIYKQMDCLKLSKEKIEILYNNKEIKFIDRYEIKFKNYIKNKLNT